MVAGCPSTRLMHLFRQFSGKRSKYISSLSPKCKRTLETSSSPAPRPFEASDKAVIPQTARPGSITECKARKGNKSSYGIGMLAKVICEQNFVYQQMMPRKEPTKRSQLGMDMHKEFLRFPGPPAVSRPRELHWTTPEEEAAHIFISVPAAVRALLKHNKRVEFQVFGHHFDRAFHGSIDSVEAEPNDHFTTLKLHEVKTTKSPLFRVESLRMAHLQASLYVFFMRQMLSREPYFDFGAYFKARGLDADRPFHSIFAAEFPSHQVTAMNSERQRPTNLNALVDQWRKWIDTLPKIEMDPYVYITILQTANMSTSLGFGQRPKVTVMPLLHEIDAALQVGQTVIDLLDGIKSPSGLGKQHRDFCKACEFHNKCPWTPELRNRPVEPLRIPIRTALPEELKQIVPDTIGPSSIPSATTSVATTDFTQAAALDPSPVVHHLFESAMQEERRRRKAHLAALFARIQEDLNPIARKRSAIAQEITALKQERETLSVVERIKLARIAVARQTTEKRRAAKEARKIAVVQISTQRKAQRAISKTRAHSPDQGSFAGPVPYVQPTQTTTALALYKPSLSWARVRRRQQRLPRYANIPAGGQPLPEDETYSVARLKLAPDTGEKWTYQFDTMPSLAERQAAMTKRDAKESAMRASRLTDAEAEEMARQARRAQRRKERDEAGR